MEGYECQRLELPTMKPLADKNAAAEEAEEAWP